MPKLKADQELRKEYQKLVDGSCTVEDFLKLRTEILDASKLDRDDAADDSPSR